MSYFDNGIKNLVHDKQGNSNLAQSQSIQNFPWLIKTENFFDSDGDFWTITYFCENLIQQKDKKPLLADIKCDAVCEISSKNLKKMNLNFERLNLIGNEKINRISRQDKTQIAVSLENLKQKIVDYSQVHIQKIKEKYPFEEKEKIVFKNCRQIHLSKFQDS